MIAQLVARYTLNTELRVQILPSVERAESATEKNRWMEGWKKGLNKEKEVFVVIKMTCKWPARPRKSDSLKETSYHYSHPS